MRLNKRYKKWTRGICSILLACVMLLGTCLPAAAGEYRPERRGSILLTLAHGENSPIPGVLLSIYKVGAVQEKNGEISFALDQRLASTGVDFSNLDTADKLKQAARRLEGAVGSSGIQARSEKTDARGKVFFSDLEQGMYLMKQGDSFGSYRIEPMLLSIPFREDGEWKYDVVAYPKTEVESGRGSLTVEKRVLFQEGEEWVEKDVKDKTYYVSLFLDEEATLPYGDLKIIHVVNDSRGKATWTDLPQGTYYLRETDAKGTALPLNKDFTEEDGSRVRCIITVKGQETTRLDYDGGESADVAAVVENRYPQSEETPTPTPTPTPTETPSGTPTPSPTPTPSRPGTPTPRPPKSPTPTPSRPGNPYIPKDPYEPYDPGEPYRPKEQVTTTPSARRELTEETGEEKKDKPVAKTGDETPVALWMSIALASAAMMGVAGVKKRRK